MAEGRADGTEPLRMSGDESGLGLYAAPAGDVRPLVVIALLLRELFVEDMAVFGRGLGVDVGLRIAEAVELDRANVPSFEDL